MRKLGEDFENEVRRIARYKWPTAQFEGAQVIDGQERDGVFETEDAVYFLEATVSENSKKAREDCQKIFKLISAHNRTDSLKPASGWFVTKQEPTAEQRKQVAEFGKGQVRALSFAQFQQSLVDVRGYLAARKNHKFGSVRDFSGKSNKPEVSFVEIGISNAADDSILLIRDIADKLLAGCHVALVGQYGAGKSMTLRELFFLLEGLYAKGSISKFPVYINLREHSGQRDPVELMERHARSIGFESPSSLVRAWRAGFVILLVDGFDEIASLGVQGSWKKLKDLRRNSLQGVRRLIGDSIGMGVIVSGRSHYFESDAELQNALGLSDGVVLSVDEFSELQVKEFLSKFPNSNNSQVFPDWLPTRPLLLGYLASRNLISHIAVEKSEMPDAVDGWDYLLGRIYKREEGIDTNLDGPTLRRILERASTLARNSSDGLGHITPKEMNSIFFEICGYEPDEQGLLAIQRLPGLGIYSAEDESRCFIDKELADVCKGHEFLRFLNDPYSSAQSVLWEGVMNSCERPLSQVSAQLVNRNFALRQSGISGVISQAISFMTDRENLACVRGDIASVLFHGNTDLEIKFEVEGVDFSGCSLIFNDEMPNLGLLSMSHSIFDELIFESSLDAKKMPIFDACLIGKIVGRLSRDDLPTDRFKINCEYSHFDGSATSGAIRDASISTGEKVLLVTLRKLFVQSISGRAESALFRGLDVNERRCVPDVLKLLKKYGLATDFSKGDGIIWLPARKSKFRAQKIISMPNECGEDIVVEARAITA